jgi:hypothetical protein
MISITFFIYVIGACAVFLFPMRAQESLEPATVPVEAGGYEPGG